MEVKLGFGAVPKPQYVFVSQESDHCWYMLSDDTKQIPIYERALTGMITGIEVNKKVETSHGETEKTDLHILAEKLMLSAQEVNVTFLKVCYFSLMF